VSVSLSVSVPWNLSFIAASIALLCYCWHYQHAAAAAGGGVDSECDKTVSVLLNGLETTLSFVDLPLPVQKVSHHHKRQSLLVPRTLKAHV